MEKTKRAEKTNKPRRKSRYWLGLLIFFVVNLIIIALVLWWLYGALGNYEAHTPKRALDNYFTQLASGEFENLKAGSGFEPDEANSWEDYTALLQRQYAGIDPASLSYRQGVSTSLSPGQALYSIYSGEEKLGEVVLTPDDASESGWRVHALFEYLPGYTVTAPQDAVVSCGGLSYSLENALATHPVLVRYTQDDRPVEVEIFQSLNDPSIAPQVAEYETAPTLVEPEFTATVHGQPCQVQVDREARTVLVTIPPTDQQQAEFGALMEEVAKTYSDFITEDGTLAALRPYLYAETSLYKDFSEYERGWYLNHESREFSDVATSGFAVYSDDFFTGHIEFTVTIIRKGEVHTFNASYDMAFIRVDDRWLLAGLHARRSDTGA